MKTAIITGKGMDSRVLTEFLLKKNYHVVIATRRATNLDLEKDFLSLFKNLLNENNKLSGIYVDLSDGFSIETGIKQILETAAIDEIYHLGAASHVGYSYQNPVLNINVNGMSCFYILETLRKFSPKTKVYFAATTELFSGNTEDKKYDENTKFHPKTPYACSKSLGYYWVQYFRETYGLFAMSGILSNHSCQYRHNSFFVKKLTQGAANIALGKQKEIYFGRLDWARDEVWADFAMEAAWKLLQLEKPQDTVVGNGSCRWGEEYLDHAFNYFNLNWKNYIEFSEEFVRKNEVIKLEVDPTLAIETINWKPNRMPFKDHIELMCEWDFEVESGRTPERPNVFDLY